MLTFKNRKTLIINIHLTNQVDNACFLATRAAQTMSVLRATICCKHYRLIKLIPQHPANKRKPGVASKRPTECSPMVAWAKGACDDFFRVPKFLVLFASKSTARTTTKRIYNNRSRVSRIEEHKTDVYPHFYVIIRSIPSTFYVEPKIVKPMKNPVECSALYPRKPFFARVR